MEVAPTRFVGRIFPETMDKRKRTDRLPGMIARFISVNFFPMALRERWGVSGITDYSRRYETAYVCIRKVFILDSYTYCK